MTGSLLRKTRKEILSQRGKVFSSMTLVFIAVLSYVMFSAMMPMMRVSIDNMYETYAAPDMMAVAYSVPREHISNITDIEGVKLLKPLSRLQLGKVKKVKTLDDVIAIGNPGDKDWEVSSGKIRSSEPSHFRFSGDAVDPGNSGCALFNMEYQLIGMITHKKPNVGFALKIDNALKTKLILKYFRKPFDMFEIENTIIESLK